MTITSLPSQNNLLLISTFSLYLIATIFFVHYVNKIQPKPYMDEIFHIPQAQKYCSNNFTYWDPKITTPPGLYLLSTGILKPLQLVGGEMFTCSPRNLRFINLLFSCGNFYLAYTITTLLQPQRVARSQMVLTALAVSLFPPMYFFTGLYYTDPGSLFFVLLMYMFHLHCRYSMAAFFGGLAILFRQTNILWVLFVAASRSLAVVQASLKVDGSRRKVSPGQLVWALYSQRRHLPLVAGEVLGETGVYLFLGLLSAGAALLNGGLSLGDHQAHTPGLHLPQAGYFLAFCLAFCWPHLAWPPLPSRFLRFLGASPVLAGSLCCLSALAINHLTYVHPYLLADNRHLVFYLWRRVISRNPATPYLLIPVYLYAGWAVLQRLSHKTPLWRASFFACVALATIPHRLLELRYFVVPYVLLRLNFSILSSAQLALEIVFYIGVNSAVLLLFSQYPFLWEGHSELQRFIW